MHVENVEKCGSGLKQEPHFSTVVYPGDQKHPKFAIKFFIIPYNKDPKIVMMKYDKHHDTGL